MGEMVSQKIAERKARETQLALAFLDTQRFYGLNHVLAEAVRESVLGTKLYASREYGPLPSGEERIGSITVSSRTTVHAAISAKKLYPESKIAVLNFTGDTAPGHGVEYGLISQEASLCRCSTLYPALTQRRILDGFYDHHSNVRDPLSTDACIYTPGVVICKNDMFDQLPSRLPPEEFVTVDVISAAPPNMAAVVDGGRPANCTRESLPLLLRRRAEHILHIAAENRADILILGAFGCGRYYNDPYKMARAFWEALKKYRQRFDLIEFAIRDGTDGEAFSAFHTRMYDWKDELTSIIKPGAAAREQYGEAFGSQVEFLTAEQLDALNSGKQLAIPIMSGEYMLFLNGPPGGEI